MGGIEPPDCQGGRRTTLPTIATTGLARAPLFACVARVRHLASPAVPPIPRDRALVLMPRTWPKRLWRRLSGWTQGRKHRSTSACGIVQTGSHT